MDNHQGIIQSSLENVIEYIAILYTESISLAGSERCNMDTELIDKMFKWSL